MTRTCSAAKGGLRKAVNNKNGFEPGFGENEETRRLISYKMERA
jgi:hypothetical protein